MDYPNTINYRCKYQRKNERELHKYFCNANVKRKKGKDCYYYILEKEHTQDCNSLSIIFEKSPNIIKNNDYDIKKYINYLDTTENYNKKYFTIALLNIFNEN